MTAQFVKYNMQYKNNMAMKLINSYTL